MRLRCVVLGRRPCYLFPGTPNRRRNGVQPSLSLAELTTSHVDDGKIGCMAELSPKALRSMREDLEAFRSAYVAYLETGRDGHGELRRNVLGLMPAADDALNASGAQIAVADPPMAGTGRVHRGLASVAFLHEQPGFDISSGWGPDPPQIYDGVIDSLDLGAANLAERERRVSIKRRSPLYWLDRLIRGLLTFPAYIVGLLVGQPTAKINASQFGLLLRLLAVVADCLAIYFGGKAFGFW